MGRFGNVMLRQRRHRLRALGRARRGGALLPHERRQHAYLQRRLRWGADQGRGLRREQVRARGVGRERRHRPGGALHRRGAVRRARRASRSTNSIQAIDDFMGRVPPSRRSRSARCVVSESAVGAEPRGAISDAPRATTDVARGHRGVSPVLRQSPSTTVSSSRSRSRTSRSRSSRRCSSRPGSTLRPIEWNDAMPMMNWLSSAEQVTLDAPRPRYRQGEHGYRLEVRSRRRRQDPHLQRPRRRSIR